MLHDPQALQMISRIDTLITNQEKPHIMTASSARFIGALQGLILGDILGAYHEFKSPAPRSYPNFRTLKHEANVFGLRFAYTDDSILAILAMEAFVEANGELDTQLQIAAAKRYLDEQTSWSPNGRCFDIGISTRRSLLDPHWPGKCEITSSGNGVLMRLAPFAWHATCRASELGDQVVIFAPEFNELHNAATQLTHGSQDTLTTTADMAQLLAGLYHGLPWSRAREPLLVRYPVLDAIPTNRAYRGYCVDSLLLAIYLMDTGDDWETSLSRILSLGGDSDTNAAILGQLYGACYPEATLSHFEPHRDDIHQANEIDALVQSFLALY